jgi:hypothetical protein
MLLGVNLLTLKLNLLCQPTDLHLCDSEFVLGIPPPQALIPHCASLCPSHLWPLRRFASSAPVVVKPQTHLGFRAPNPNSAQCSHRLPGNLSAPRRLLAKSIPERLISSRRSKNGSSV